MIGVHHDFAIQHVCKNWCGEKILVVRHGRRNEGLPVKFLAVRFPFMFVIFPRVFAAPVLLGVKYGNQRDDNGQRNQNPPHDSPVRFGFWCFVHAVKGFMVSVRGFGGKILGRSTSVGKERSVSSSSSHFCWSRNVIIISGDGVDFAIMVCEPSRWAKLTMKIRIQIVASPVQIWRHGQINSSQRLFEPPRHQDTKLTAQLCALVSWWFNPATTSRRMASSFGALD